MGKSKGEEWKERRWGWAKEEEVGGAPRGHGGGSLEEAHTLICHVLVCLGAQKSALQSPVETQATVWFTAAAAAARPMCGYRRATATALGLAGGGWGRSVGSRGKESSRYPSDNASLAAVFTKQTPVSI